MRKVTKQEIPQVLADNAAGWTDEYKADLTNKTKKYRYRHADIKKALLAETSHKCVYCESKIGHNTPGDVEHKTPTSANMDTHFSWDNLTIACTECNRRKLAYYDPANPFLDPYTDDVDARVVHLGPIVGWQPGDTPAETTIRKLELHDYTREQLIKRKVERIDDLNNLVARLGKEEGVLRDLLYISLEKMKAEDAEFSGMVKSVCSRYGI